MVSEDAVLVGLFFGMVTFLSVLFVWATMREREHPGHFTMDLTEDEKWALEQARERLVDRSWEMGMPEFGQLIYGKNTYPKFTIHFYKDGIVAPFVFNGAPERRFVPYELISGVFPVMYKSPSQARPVPALQIETSDYATFIVRSWYYDLDYVKKLLRRGLVHRWAEVFHPEEVLRGEMFSSRYDFRVTDDLLKHEAVRRMGQRGRQR